MCARTLECKSKEIDWFKWVFIPLIKITILVFPPIKAKEVPTVGLPSHRLMWGAQSRQHLMRMHSVYRSAMPWTSEKALALMEDKTRQVMTKAREHQNPHLHSKSRTAGFWGAIMGSKNSATPAHFIQSPRPMPRRKKCPMMNKESPNFQETSPKTILSSAN